MSKCLQTLLFLLLCVTAANATKLKGNVYDRKTGEPMVGATVSLDKTGKATTTGLDGSFELKDVPKGHFALKVSYVMYKTTVQELDIEKEDNPRIKVYL